MPVDIERHRQQLRHHRVVGDQGGQRGVVFQEPLGGGGGGRGGGERGVVVVSRLMFSTLNSFENLLGAGILMWKCQIWKITWGKF